MPARPILSHPIRFAGLPYSARLVVWSTRKWAELVKTGPRDLDHLQQAYRFARAADALPVLDGFLTVLIIAYEARLEIRKVGEAMLSADEARLVDLIASLQASAMPRAADLLDAWLPPAGHPAVLQQGRRFARLLAMAGHFLPSVEPATAGTETKRIG